MPSYFTDDEIRNIAEVVFQTEKNRFRSSMPEAVKLQMRDALRDSETTYGAVEAIDRIIAPYRRK